MQKSQLASKLLQKETNISTLGDLVLLVLACSSCAIQQEGIQGSAEGDRKETQRVNFNDGERVIGTDDYVKQFVILVQGKGKEFNEAFKDNFRNRRTCERYPITLLYYFVVLVGS